MQRIAIDMDDVMADAAGRFIEYAEMRLGKKILPIDLHNRTWAEVAGVSQEVVRKWLFEEGFFRGMRVMPHSQEVIKKLMEKYEVFIVSAATEFPNSLKEKLEWLNEHFPYISWTHTVFCGHKYMIQADYLIDDHEKNLVRFPGKPILFSAPHNLLLNDYTRVNDWHEVEKMFL
jgi:5'(3')-deoxyribonucleotidase